MSITTAGSSAPLCRPSTASHFELEHEIDADGIHVDIPRFGWDRACAGQFRANAYYIDYSLVPRPIRSRLFRTDRRPTPPLGDIVFMPQDSQFDALCAPGEKRLLCLTFDREQARRVFEIRGGEDDQPPCFDVRAPHVRQGLARLAQEVREPGFSREILIQSIALTLIVDLYRHLQGRGRAEEDRRAHLAGWRLRRLEEKVEAELSRPLSIADLARECGLSPRHLGRTFRNTVGVTLSDYVAAARIRLAMLALAAGNTPIKAVAADCGFRSAAGLLGRLSQSHGDDAQDLSPGTLPPRPMTRFAAARR